MTEVLARVSVIIPVYNVEQYLRRCVDSVLNQTMSELEVILVDDGSPDQSPVICDQYAEKDGRVQVIHKQNGGLASARNAGLERAKGKYIFFLDSDDWLEPDGMELLYKTAEEYQVDFVRYRAIRTGWPGLPINAPCKVEPIRELTEGLYDRKRIREEVYPRLLGTSQLTMGAVVGAWGSLYRHVFLKNNKLSFSEEVKFSEDQIFSARVVLASNRFYFIDTPCVYHYFYNPKSISKSFRAGRWESCKETIRLAEKEFSDCAEYDFTNQLNQLRWFCVLLALNERHRLNSYNEKIAYCRNILNDPVLKEYHLHFNGLNVSWKQRVLMMFIVHCDAIAVSLI